MKLRSIILSLGAALLFAAPGAAFAQGAAAARSKAQEIYGAGEAAFQQKRYQDALQAFNEAYLLDPVPVLLYNIGRAHEELGQFDQAARFFQRYLDRVPDAQDRPQVEQRLTLLKRAAAAEAEAEKAKAEAKKARAEAKEARTHDAEASEEREVVGTATVGGGPGLLPWVTVGAGGLLLVGSGLFYSFASDDATKAGEVAPNAAGRRRYNELRDSKDTNEALAVATLGLGLAAVGGGLAWYFLADDGDAAVSVAPTAGGLVLGGRF